MPRGWRRPWEGRCRLHLSWERPRTGHVQVQEGQWVDGLTWCKCRETGGAECNEATGWMAQCKHREARQAYQSNLQPMLQVSPLILLVRIQQGKSQMTIV